MRYLRPVALPATLALALLLGPFSSAFASNYPITEIKDIAEPQAAALKAAGVEDTNTLLDKAKTQKDRAALAKATKIKAATLLQWAKMADLMRIPGVGPEAVTLLGAAKVDTVKAFVKKDPAKLAEEIKKANDKARANGKPLTEKPPTVESLSTWLEAAKGLPVVLK